MNGFCVAANPKLFREYIGAESDSVKLSQVPINPQVEFHFILAFAVDYTSGGSKTPSPTNGNFNALWETKFITPAEIVSIKQKHPNVKLALSLGGDTVGHKKAFFAPNSMDSWVQNAIRSLTNMIKLYHIDGIDIDYEHFTTDQDTFVECIGRLITNLKETRTISFASIAPFDDDDDGPVQKRYIALWNKYKHVIDYVNFQFYAYEKLSVPQFVKHFNRQTSNYEGGQILASFISDGGQGLGPDDGFFEACKELMGQGKLGGIFVWCADESARYGFRHETTSQNLLVSRI